MNTPKPPHSLLSRQCPFKFFPVFFLCQRQFVNIRIRIIAILHVMATTYYVDSQEWIQQYQLARSEVELPVPNLGKFHHRFAAGDSILLKGAAVWFG